MKKELVVSFGRYDGVNIICVYYQTLANTRKEILLQLVKGFHKVVQLERHRHRLSVEEMHVTVNTYICGRKKPKNEDGLGSA